MRYLFAALLGIVSSMALASDSFYSGEIIADVQITVDCNTIVSGLERPVMVGGPRWEASLQAEVRKVGLSMRRIAAANLDPCDVARRALAVQTATRIVNATRTVPCEPGPEDGFCYFHVPELVCSGG